MSEKIYKDGFKILGNQYYKYIGDEVVLIRVVSVKNADMVKVLYEGGDTFMMHSRDIQDEFELLTPDGMITFTVAQMGEDSEGRAVEDVVVCLYRQNEMQLGDYSPYVVCRQNINDFFANYLDTTGNGTNMCGVSVSRDTCPENIDFDMVRACNDISDPVTINFYIEDTVESLLAMIKPNKMKVYNRVLETCYETHIKAFPSAKDMLLSLNKLPYHGYCTTLKELLELNNFQYDFDSAFNILAINADISEEQELVESDILGNYYTLPNDIMNELSKVFKQNIVETIVVPYTHEIAIEELINSKYFILRDKKNILYIVNYITKGEYRETDLEVIAAETAMNRARSLFGNTIKNKYK